MTWGWRLSSSFRIVDFFLEMTHICYRIQHCQTGCGHHSANDIIWDTWPRAPIAQYICVAELQSCTIT